MKFTSAERLGRCSCFAILAAVVAIALQSLPCFAQTLAQVKARGAVICGVNPRLLGFSFSTERGWRGFDVDLCRAVAVAVFGDDKVKFVPLSATERFAALQAGKIDILSRNSTWTMLRETGFGIVFPAITYFDGQGFLVRKTFSATSVLELNNAKICVEASTTTTSNLADYFESNNMRSERVAFTSKAKALEAYDAGRCDAFTSDISELHAHRLELNHPQEHQILPDIISKQPLGPVVRKGDEQWADIVKWTIFALINAEELGVSSKNIDQALHSKNPEIKHLLGINQNYAERLGLRNDWAVSVVRVMGNYGEIFERNIGANSDLRIPRGLNRLWTAGGLLYAPPIGPE